PEVWAARLLTSLKTNLVYGAPGVVNRDYQGEISQYGDTVHITSVGRPTVDDYTAHEDIEFEEVDDADRTLLIDQAKYFAFEVDDIEAAQARGNVKPEAMSEAGFALRDVADSYVASLMATDVHEDNQVAEAEVEDADGAEGVLISLKT